VVHLEARHEVVHAFASHDKVKAVFGELIADVPLDEGVRRMAAWARQTGARKGSISSRIEVEKNMPNSWRAELSRAGDSG
jgi:UDP-glucose 4-epimerase